MSIKQNFEEREQLLQTNAENEIFCDICKKQFNNDHVKSDDDNDGSNNGNNGKK